MLSMFIPKSDRRSVFAGDDTHNQVMTLHLVFSVHYVEDALVLYGCNEGDGKPLKTDDPNSD